MDDYNSTNLLLKILYEKCLKKDNSNLTFMNIVLLLKNMGIIEDNYIVDDIDNQLVPYNFIQRNIVSMPRYISDFSELHLIGSGGFGEVFLSKNKIDKINYAIKKIYVNISDPVIANLTLNEIFILSRLNHPNIVRYFSSWIENSILPIDYDSSNYSSANSIYSDFSTSSNLNLDSSNKSNSDILLNSISNNKIELNNLQVSDDMISLSKIKDISNENPNINIGFTVYIQMEFCKGITLDFYLKKRKYIDKHINFKILSNLVKGVEYIHKMNVIHRDIKPSNIFINNNFVKLGDFGLSTMKKNSCLNDEFGSCLYLEGSIKQGEVCTKSMDIFSLGIVIIELYSIFKTDMERYISLSDPIKYIDNCDIDANIKKIISLCICKDIEKRLQINELCSLILFSFN